MHRLLFASVFLVLSVRVASAQEAIANKLPIVSGPVKTIRLESFDLKKVSGKWSEGEKRWRTDTSYNPEKSRIEVALYMGGQNIFRKEVYSFDPQGKLTNWDLYEADGRHTGTKATYIYVKGGRMSEAIHHLLGSFSYKETFYYPDERHVEATTQFHFNEKPDKEVYTYDDKGNIVEAIFYEEDGRLRVKESYKYDGKGNPVEFAAHSPTGALLYKETHRYEFDARGNWIKRTTSEYDPDKGRLQVEPAQVAKRTISYY